jgi:hypothetical protein
MASDDESPSVTLRERSSDPTAGFDVIRDGAVIGSIRPFQLGAGQFGRRWLAERPDGAQSTDFTSREAAADWLVDAGRD